MAFFKSISPALILTLILSGIIGSQGSTGGVMGIQHKYIYDYGYYWSWSTFLCSLGVVWALIIMQGD
ncbi:hypothetical protein RXV95_00075 [Novosphingobium sp. ZN18A2]|uniref:hypothetical protein n=1 Tax=Novosphingobium sp. ZN18A2 TaxID=3079861 RepID=UPI0030CE1CD5